MAALQRCRWMQRWEVEAGFKLAKEVRDLEEVRFAGSFGVRRWKHFRKTMEQGAAMANETCLDRDGATGPGLGSA